MAPTHVPNAGRLTLALIALLATLLICFQYSTLAKLGVLPPGMTYVEPANYLAALRERVVFDWFDGLLVSLILGTCLAITACEFLGRGLTALMPVLFVSARRTLAALVLCSMVACRFYLALGDLSWAGDASEHLVSAQITAGLMAAGEFPVWTNAFGAGSPYLQFYGFAFFYLVGLADLLLRDLFLSLKLVLFLTHSLSGVGMYFLAAALCRSRRAGFLAGLAYVLCFWHTQHVLFLGRLPLSLFYALLPWPFYSLEALRDVRRRRSMAAAGGLSLGLLVLIHPGYGFWAIAFFVLYAALRLWFRPDLAAGLGVAAHAAALLGTALAFSACLTLPMWLERESTALAAGPLGVSLSGAPDPSWRHLLGWSNFRFWLLPLGESSRHWYGGYLGGSLLLLAAFGIWALAWRRPPKVRPHLGLAAAICLVLSLVAVLGYRWSLVQWLPGLTMLAAYRYLLFAAFFLALMVGVGTRALLVAGPMAHRSRLVALLLLAVAIDLGPTTLQQPYSREFATQDRDPTGLPNAFFAWLHHESAKATQQGDLPPYRVFWSLREIHPFLALSRLYFAARTPTPQSIAPGDLRAVSEGAAPLERYLSCVLRQVPENALPDVPIETLTAITGALRLLNVRYLLSTQADGGIRVNEWPMHTPFLVAGKAAALAARDREDQVDLARLGNWQPHPDDAGIAVDTKALMASFWIAGKYGLSFENNACREIPLAPGVLTADLETAPAGEVLAHRVWHQRVELQVRVSAPCFARLAYAYFPYLDVFVDGNKAESLETADHFVALRLDEGEHLIVLEARLSPLRRWLLLLDLVLLGAAIWIWRSEHRPQQPAR
jgi:hypothetical protein